MALVDFNRRRENDRRVNQDREAKASTTSGIPAGSAQKLAKNISTGETVAVGNKETLYSGPTTGNGVRKATASTPTKGKTTRTITSGVGPKEKVVSREVDGEMDSLLKKAVTKIKK